MNAVGPLPTVATSGAKIPLLGLGTWDLRGRTCARMVEQALRLGYRHIDTAEMYDNEREVGEGDSAQAAFETYLADGGDSGVGLLELARTDSYTHRDSAGHTDYFAGARAAGSVAAIRMYRTDFSWIATPQELAAMRACMRKF